MCEYFGDLDKEVVRTELSFFSFNKEKRLILCVLCPVLFAMCVCLLLKNISSSIRKILYLFLGLHVLTLGFMAISQLPLHLFKLYTFFLSLHLSL
ncbi:hypothetical protein EDC96DRAFT_339868 [Choanephora cucurbitarum]|nr:hypothetical protein EDC96DRAFT_339868 [Choanephora cucurbitarum]